MVTPSAVESLALSSVSAMSSAWLLLAGVILGIEVFVVGFIASDWGSELISMRWFSLNAYKSSFVGSFELLIDDKTF